MMKSTALEETYKLLRDFCEQKFFYEQRRPSSLVNHAHLIFMEVLAKLLSCIINWKNPVLDFIVSAN